MRGERERRVVKASRKCFRGHKESMEIVERRERKGHREVMEIRGRTLWSLDFRGRKVPTDCRECREWTRIDRDRREFRESRVWFMVHQVIKECVVP